MLGNAGTRIPRVKKKHFGMLGKKKVVLGKAWRGLGRSLERFWKGIIGCLDKLYVRFWTNFREASG